MTQAMVQTIHGVFPLAEQDTEWLLGYLEGGRDLRLGKPISLASLAGSLPYLMGYWTAYRELA